MALGDQILTITFNDEAAVGDLLDWTIAETVSGVQTIVDDKSFEWVTVEDGFQNDPYEVAVQAQLGSAGFATAAYFKSKLDNILLISQFTYELSGNVLTLTISNPDKYFTTASYTGDGSATLNTDSTPNGDTAVLTFISEGIETTEVTFSIDKPDLDEVEDLVFDWKATPIDAYDVPVVATSGTVGSQTALNFANVFGFNNNQSNDYIITVEENVVTIQTIHPSWSFFWEITNTAGTGAVDNSDSTLSVYAEILGQELGAQTTYCYLYEPLNAVIEETNLAAKKIYIDIDIVDTSDSTNIVDTLVKYGEFDINPGNSITIGLMEMAAQYHNANLYKLSNVSELAGEAGKNSVVSKYKYNFKIYSDVTVINDGTLVSKLPIIGVREFEDFTAVVDVNSPITEAVQESIDLTNRWLGYPVVETTLADPSLTDSSPTIVATNQTSGTKPCGGYILWKSTLGGWMTWGMGLKTKSYKGKYTGKLEVNNFESTLKVGGNPYIPVNYTGVETSYSLNLKALSLLADELVAVSNIAYSPAVYFVREDGKTQLMKLGSVSAPLKTLARGGDFSIRLSSIERTGQNVM